MVKYLLLFDGHYLAIQIILILLAFIFGYKLLKFLTKKYRRFLPIDFIKRIRWPLLILFLSIYLLVYPFEFQHNIRLGAIINHSAILLIIFSVTWLIILFLKIIKERILNKYSIDETDNLRARKIQTQYVILENTIIFIVVVLAIGVALMSFSSIRNIGISIFTSAGIAGIVLGFAAQKALVTIFAGIQIAITQPIRLDDVVIIEEEWGRIEEITLTFVVVKLWDKRRLIVPSTYFIESTFQNWTRTTADILGSVFLYVDYNIPIKALREELTRILKTCSYWDGEVDVMQVTDVTESTIEIRALMSARDSSEAFDLRAYVREHLMLFIQKNYPETLPKTRFSEISLDVQE